MQEIETRVRRRWYPAIWTITWLCFQITQNDHDVLSEMEGKQFTRMQIVFREGNQVFKSYAQRGLCLAGTFLKNVNGGILLVACVLNGNQQIKIVSVAIVSIENEANGSFFLRNLGMILPVKPSLFFQTEQKGWVRLSALFIPAHITSTASAIWWRISTRSLDLLNWRMKHGD